MTRIHYRIDPSQQYTHLYRITLTVEQPVAGQEFMLPVWIPGSYLVREFAKHLQGLSAEQQGLALAMEAVDKHRWRVQCQAGQPLRVHYQVAAYDPSVRAAWLDSQRGFFNGTSVCLCVCGQENLPHVLEIIRPDDDALAWQLATGLSALDVQPDGFGTYLASNYDELVDCPVEMGCFQRFDFHVRGVPHSLVVSGAAPSFDGERLAVDARRICEEIITFWHGETECPPFAHYVFLLHAMHDSYGGLEHRNSTALVCPRRSLPQRGQSDEGRRASEGYTQLLGLISHEYFHTWNVKRLRPKEFTRYDYTCENYTELLWFFEGFTSYYDDLLLCRADLIGHAAYLRLLAKTINQVLQTPGRHVQSVAQASFDAWIKFYRADENTPNVTVNYYTKGALVALCLDLSLRHEGQTTLDAVMRALWRHTGGGAITEADLLTQLQRLSGRDWSKEVNQWVHGTTELPLKHLLSVHGVRLSSSATAPLASRLAHGLGLRLREGGGIHIKIVLRGSVAETAGLMAGDEWLAVETADGSAWRIQALDDIPVYIDHTAQPFTAIVVRDARLLRLPLQLPVLVAEDDAIIRLSPLDQSMIRRWLGS